MLAQLQRSYTNRVRAFSVRENANFSEFWSIYGIDTESKALDLKTIFGRDAPVILDIGFGMGHVLVEMASMHPEMNFLGVEVYRRGVLQCLTEIVRRSVTNIRVICADAVVVLQHQLADQCLHGVQIHFPDPWPKRRHHKRRLIQGGFIDILLPKLLFGGYIHIKTDWQDYAGHVQKVFRNYSQCLQVNPSDFIQCDFVTKYERRGESLGHSIHELCYSLEKVNY